MDIQTILVALLGSSLLAAIISNRQNDTQHRKEVVAGATKSALKRVEMYYRLKRRLSDGSEDSGLRDQLHLIQEENDYYAALLDIESPWLGSAYRHFLNAIRAKLLPLMHSAWEKPGEGPATKVTDGPELNQYIKQFSQDSRHLFNPIMRTYERLRYRLGKVLKENRYESI